MKTFILGLAIVCIASTAGTFLYLNSEKSPSIPAAVTDLSPPPIARMPSQTTVAPKQQKQQAVSGNVIGSEPAPLRNATSDNSNPAPLSQNVDTLVSRQTGYNDRWSLLRHLKDAGQLDAAITELNQRVADNPGDAETQIALGEAMMSKFPIQDYNEAAMLGLKIDQSFDAALKADPSNWEAQYSKAQALSGWPPQMNTGPEVVQQLSSLVDQQQTMQPEPQFANTYALLGDEYQKLGQSQKAQDTWQLGLQKFPDDAALQKRTSSQ